MDSSSLRFEDYTGFLQLVPFFVILIVMHYALMLQRSPTTKISRRLQIFKATIIIYDEANWYFKTSFRLENLVYISRKFGSSE